MPLFVESRSKQAWRRETAAWLTDRVQTEGSVRFYGTSERDRREMLRVAELLAPKFVAALQEDPLDPTVTVMEVRLPPAPPAVDIGFRIIPRDEATG